MPKDPRYANLQPDWMSESTLERPPLAPGASKRGKEYASIQGKQLRLDVDASGIVKPTQLISARVQGAPRQWVVTLAQVLAPNTESPWFFDGEGTTAFPGVNTIPKFPAGANLMVDIRFGTGGVSYRSQFDYPVNGGIFGVTADTLTLSAFFRNAASFPYTVPADVPFVGASMVEGIAASENPITWSEDPDAIAVGLYVWTVKPYAKRVRIALQGGAAGTYFEFVDEGGTVLWHQPIAPNTVVEANVPGSSVILVIGSSGAANAYVQWDIGLT